MLDPSYFTVVSHRENNRYPRIILGYNRNFTLSFLKKQYLVSYSHYGAIKTLECGKQKGVEMIVSTLNIKVNWCKTPDSHFDVGQLFDLFFSSIYESPVRNQPLILKLADGGGATNNTGPEIGGLDYSYRPLGY